MQRFGFDEHTTRMNERNLLYQVIQQFANVDLSPERVDNMQMGYYPIPRRSQTAAAARETQIELSWIALGGHGRLCESLATGSKCPPDLGTSRNDLTCRHRHPAGNHRESRESGERPGWAAPGCPRSRRRAIGRGARVRRQSVLAVRAALILLAALAMLAARPPASAQTPGTDATLSGLTLSEGRLSPAFASGTTAYTASVGYTVTRIAVVPSHGRMPTLRSPTSTAATCL